MKKNQVLTASIWDERSWESHSAIWGTVRVHNYMRKKKICIEFFVVKKSRKLHITPEYIQNDLKNIYSLIFLSAYAWGNFFHYKHSKNSFEYLHYSHIYYSCDWWSSTVYVVCTGVLFSQNKFNVIDDKEVFYYYFLLVSQVIDFFLKKYY
jgi:hypothetical protein